MRFFKFTFLLLIVFFYGCTHNPFFGEDDSIENTTFISGRVILEEAIDGDHSGTFVWLRGINIKTWTEKDGSFELELPNPKTLPGGPQAWTGEMPLYFYVNNYKIDSVVIIFLNGEIFTDQDHINESGQLKKDITLVKMLDIKTSFSSDSIEFDGWGYHGYDTYFKFISLYYWITPRGEGCNIFTYLKNSNQVQHFFIFDVENPVENNYQFIRRDNDYQPILLSPGVPVTKFISSETTLFTKHRILTFLPSGYYKVIPFVHVVQPGIPIEMFIEIGEYPDRFTSEYLKMPIKFSGDILKVTLSGGFK